MNIKEVNEYIYLINEIFIGKEVIVYYKNNTKTFSLYMGLKNNDINLPFEETNELIFESGLFQQETGSFNQDSYILKDLSELKNWFNKQIDNKKINSINIEKFEPVIKQLRRLKNLDKLLK